ncbi:LamB/YcsF family protein [Frateuria aurantia]
MKAIDLNADLGEGFGPWRMGADEQLLQVLSSANIACGYHAGDPLIMRRTIRMAIDQGVDIGAHVGYPDLQGFGRRPMQIDTEELAAMVIYQLAALGGMARAEGGAMTHMSFHGALGNRVAADHALAQILLGAVASYDDQLMISSSPSAAIAAAAVQHGLRLRTTFLADRACDRHGLLVPRGVAGAVIHDPAHVVERVRQLLAEGTVTTFEGSSLPVAADSILVHGDTEGALALARLVRDEILAAGGAVCPLSRMR